MKTSLFVGSAGALLLLTSSAFASTLHFTAVPVTGAAEVPPVNSSVCIVTGDCSASFSYDTVTHKLCGAADFKADLQVTGAHIHKGGPAEGNGPIAVDFNVTAATTNTLKWAVTVTDAAAQAELEAAYTATDSTLYFNVHTVANGGGEARGNVRKDDNAPNLDECEPEADAGVDSGVTTVPTDGGGTTTTPSDGGTSSSSGGTSTSSCSTAPGTSPGSVVLMLGAAVAVGSMIRRKKR